MNQYDSLKTAIHRLLLYGLLLLQIACNNHGSNDWIEQHNQYNNHWITGTEVGFVFKSAYIDTAGNAYAISASGIVLYRPKGGHWTKEELPVSNRRFYCIAGRGKEVWVAGEEGLILYRQAGQPWVQEKHKAGLIDLNSIYVTRNELWMVGSGGSIIHKKDTAGWEVETCPEENATLTAIKGTPGNLWVIGDEGIILHKTANGKWRKEAISLPKVKLTDLLVQDNQVWVATNIGLLLHKTDSTQWTPEKVVTGKGSRLDNLSGWNNQVWVTTDNGLILYKKGNAAWVTEKKHPVNGYFIGSYCRHHDIWLAGSHNVILHKHENEPWVQEATPPSSEILTTVTGNGNQVIAAGFNESILDRNAAGQWQYSNEMITNAPLNGIYALDEEAWVSDNKGNILYKNRNNNWKKEPSGLPTLQIKDGYRYGEDIWLIGEPAVIIHKHGNAPWKNETPTIKGAKLNAIYGHNDEVWVAGTNSTLLHKKGGSQQWINDYEGKAITDFNAITGIGNDLYVLGSLVTILHKKIDQPNWVQENIDAEEVRDLRYGHFHAICKTDSGLYAVGGDGLILHKKNRGNWVREMINDKGIDLKDMAVMDGTVWAIGNIGEELGVILCKRPGKEWVKLEMPWTNFLKIIPYRGLCLITKKGFIYKENDTKNFLFKRVMGSIGSVVGAAACSGQLYFAGNNSIIKVMPDQRQYPTVTRMRYFTSALFHPDSLEIQFTVQSPPREKYKDLRRIRIDLAAKKYNDWRTSKESYQQVPGSSRIIDSVAGNSFTFAFRFEIADQFRITPGADIGNKLVVKVTVSSDTEGLTEEITLKDRNGEPFLTIGNDVWHNNKNWITGVLLLVLYYSLFLLLWLVKPLWFLKIYRTAFFTQLASLQPPFKQVLIIADILLPLRLLAHKDRVINAWISANSNVLTQQFLDNKTVSTKADYISLPVQTGDHLATQINEPDAAFCAGLFNGERTIVQLIGQGGAGKTMLAVAMGRWMMQPHQHQKKNITRIPVLIESGTGNLLQSLKELFHAWFNMPKVDDSFLITLLKKQRLVIIIDAFSELSHETQAYIRNIHATLPVNALFITTRHAVALQANECTRLYMAPFNSESLVHFITQLLEENKDHPLTKYHDQIIFAKEILRQVNKDGRNKGVTPMLVKLIVDNALSKVTSSTPVEAMLATIPGFIPKVYYDYLCNTHPVQETTQHSLSLQQVVTVAEDMALLSLQEDFIPRDFKEGDILPRLLADPQFGHINPVDRLVENGIITRRNSLGVFYLRFNLDTMAEYLGASRLYDRHRDDPHQLHAFIDTVNMLGDEAAGFKMAFEHIKEYKVKNG